MMHSFHHTDGLLKPPFVHEGVTGPVREVWVARREVG